MAIEVFDPQSQIPWRLHKSAFGPTRQMLIVTGKIYIRTERADEHTTPELQRLLLQLAWIDSKGEACPHEPEHIGVVLDRVMNELSNSQGTRALRGSQSDRLERSESPQRERAQRTTAKPEPQAREAGVSEPSGSLANAGRFTSDHQKP